MVYIPADVHKDSAFPFDPREVVNIEIVRDKLVVSKTEG